MGKPAICRGSGFVQQGAPDDRKSGVSLRYTLLFPASELGRYAIKETEL